MLNIKKHLTDFIPLRVLSSRPEDIEYKRVIQYLLRKSEKRSLKQLFPDKTVRERFSKRLQKQIRYALSLHLHREIGISILILGEDVMPLSAACKAFGHEVTIITGKAESYFLEEDWELQNILQLPLRKHNFTPSTSLPAFEKKFDLICSSTLDASDSVSVWSADNWSYLLHDLFKNHRGVNGRLHLKALTCSSEAIDAFDASAYRRVVEPENQVLSCMKDTIIFGDFSAPRRSTSQKANPQDDTKKQLQDFIKKNKSASKGFMCELVNLSQFALDDIDFEEYEKLKSYHFSESSPTRPNKRKYFDLLYYLKAKLRVATALGLHRKRGLHILDIGTGVGHLPYICKFYGHTVVATDIPDNTTEGGFASAEALAEWTKFPEERRSIYKDLLRVLGVERIDHRIEAFTPVGLNNEKFDIITALMVSFDKYFLEQTLWGLKEWEYLIHDLKKNHLKENGIIYLQMNKSSHYQGMHFDAPEFVRFFEEHGATVNLDKSLITFGPYGK